MLRTDPLEPEVVRVDVDKEVRRLAQADKVDLRLLKQPVDLTRYDYYRSTVVSYYRGRDHGFVEAFAQVAHFYLRARVLFVLSLVFLLAGVLFWLGVFGK
jgi:hypothetical protein